MNMLFPNRKIIGYILFGCAIAIFLYGQIFGISEFKSKIERFREFINRQIKESSKVKSEESFIIWKKNTMRIIKEWVKPRLGVEGWEIRFEKGRYGIFDPEYNAAIWVVGDFREISKNAVGPHINLLQKMIDEITPENLN